MKALIAYYSRRGMNYAGGSVVDLPKGNTEVAAEFVRDATGGDLFRIDTVKEYPSDYNACTRVAQDELEEDARPELSAPLPDLSAYDAVFVGYPNWWGTAPMAVFAFLEAANLTGKIVAPFCTHEGSGLSGSERDVAKASPGARMKKGLAIRGSSVGESRGEIEAWVKGVVG